MCFRIVGGCGEELLDRECDFNGSSAVRCEREFPACPVILRAVNQPGELKRRRGIRTFFDRDRLVGIGDVGHGSAPCDDVFHRAVHISLTALEVGIASSESSSVVETAS